MQRIWISSVVTVRPEYYDGVLQDWRRITQEIVDRQESIELYVAGRVHAEWVALRNWMRPVQHSLYVLAAFASAEAYQEYWQTCLRTFPNLEERIGDMRTVKFTPWWGKNVPFVSKDGDAGLRSPGEKTASKLYAGATVRVRPADYAKVKEAWKKITALVATEIGTEAYLAADAQSETFGPAEFESPLSHTLFFMERFDGEPALRLHNEHCFEIFPNVTDWLGDVRSTVYEPFYRKGYPTF